MKLITWSWGAHPPLAQRRLLVNFKGRHAITLLTSIANTRNTWLVTSPRVFPLGGRVGIGLSVKEAAAIVRQVISEMMAEEFAGVDR